jgi:PAS domain S-box-containing protein
MAKMASVNSDKQNQLMTEERRAEEALRESEAALMSIFRAAPIGIGVVSNRILKRVNDRICQMTGYTREELLEKHARILYPTDDESEYVGREKYRQIREYGTGSVETRWQRKDGKIINVLLSSTPINPSNLAASITFTALDITEQKQAEEKMRQYADKLEQRVAKRTAQLEEKAKELEQANSQLKRADQLKSVFLASMSHELRTPLNSIIGFTGILLMEMAGKLNDEQKKQLKMVKDSADHLLNLINDILDISWIEAGRVDLSLEKFLLNDVLNEVTEIFSSQAAQKGLELIVNIPGKIFLFNDMRRIKQILINLVSNAVKFTEQGRITITSTILPDEKVEISVADTGIGIKEEFKDKLFNPFQQVDVNLTKQFEGTGLGLYLCKSLVNLLGGEISAQSQYKKGSVFIVILPLKMPGS